MASACAFVKPIRRLGLVTGYSVNWPKPSAYITSARSKEVADRLLLVCQAQPATATKIELQVACDRARSQWQTEGGVEVASDAAADTAAQVANAAGDEAEAAAAAAPHIPLSTWNWICKQCGGCNVAVFSLCQDCGHARTDDAQLVEPVDTTAHQSSVALAEDVGDSTLAAGGHALKRPASATKGHAHHSFSLAQKRAIVREALQRFGCTLQEDGTWQAPPGREALPEEKLTWTGVQEKLYLKQVRKWSVDDHSQRWEEYSMHHVSLAKCKTPAQVLARTFKVPTWWLDRCERHKQAAAPPAADQLPVPAFLAPLTPGSMAASLPLPAFVAISSPAQNATEVSEVAALAPSVVSDDITVTPRKFRRLRRVTSDETHVIRLSPPCGVSPSTPATPSPGLAAVSLRGGAASPVLLPPSTSVAASSSDITYVAVTPPSTNPAGPLPEDRHVNLPLSTGSKPCLFGRFCSAEGCSI